jgi:hypothetical protein
MLSQLTWMINNQERWVGLVFLGSRGCTRMQMANRVTPSWPRSICRPPQNSNSYAPQGPTGPWPESSPESLVATSSQSHRTASSHSKFDCYACEVRHAVFGPNAPKRWLDAMDPESGHYAERFQRAQNWLDRIWCGRLNALPGPVLTSTHARAKCQSDWTHEQSPRWVRSPPKRQGPVDASHCAISAFVQPDSGS